MNVKTILIAALVSLGTLSVPTTADAHPRKYRHRHYSHPQYYKHHHYYRGYPRHYYYRPYRAYPRYYNNYYYPRYRRGTYFNFQYGPLSVQGWR